jgi:hypothetical protein
MEMDWESPYRRREMGREEMLMQEGLDTPR